MHGIITYTIAYFLLGSVGRTVSGINLKREEHVGKRVTPRNERKGRTGRCWVFELVKRLVCTIPRVDSLLLYVVFLCCFVRLQFTSLTALLLKLDFVFIILEQTPLFCVWLVSSRSVVRILQVAAVTSTA